ncbi:adenylate kinase 8 isoform X3 [Stigmatopora nigra]
MMESVHPLRVPPQMAIYADQHNIIHLVQSMVSSLAVEQPEDPIAYLLLLLQESSVHVPRVVLLGPPAVGKTAVARKLCADVNAVHVTMETLLDNQSQLGEQARQYALKQQEVPDDLLVDLIQERLKQSDCFNTGWVLDGLPQTRLQARNLQQGGVIPKHVVLLAAAEDVLLERHRGGLTDSFTGDIYHEMFARPVDNEVWERAERRTNSLDGGLSLKVRLQRYCCEVTGISSAYRHILKTVDADQPPLDVYHQVMAFLQTRSCSRTPRVLLLGPPGSGKRHQARMLAEKYKMVDVCCRDLLHWAQADQSPIGEEVRTYLTHRRAVPSSVVLKVLDERLNRVDCSQRGWILHHLPCNLQHTEHLALSFNAPNRVFFLELLDEVCFQRSTKKHSPTNTSVHVPTTFDENMRTVSYAIEVYRTQTAGLQSRIVEESVLMKTLCGTPSYLAPEVLTHAAAGGGYGLAVDAWSLGVLIFICLCGYPPFHESFHELSVSEQIVRGRFTMVPAKWCHVSEQAKDVVRRLLVVDPAQRMTIDDTLQHAWMQDTVMLEKARRLMYLPSDEEHVGSGVESRSSRKRPREDQGEEQRPTKQASFIDTS